MESAEDRKITVSEETARVIREKVEEGSFSSPSEVVEAAMQALEREARDRADRLVSIKARIQASIEDPRPAVPIEQAFERILRPLRDRLGS